jgi:hypothetical protein
MGKAYCKIKVSPAAMMVKNGENIVQRETSRILTQLPYGTKMVSIEKSLVRDLHINYIVIFEHPVFIDDSEIKDITNYTRDFGVNPNPKDGEQKVYNFNKTNNLNFDDFINKEYPKEEK